MRKPHLWQHLGDGCAERRCGTGCTGGHKPRLHLSQPAALEHEGQVPGHEVHQPLVIQVLHRRSVDPAQLVRHHQPLVGRPLPQHIRHQHLPRRRNSHPAQTALSIHAAWRQQRRAATAATVHEGRRGCNIGGAAPPHPKPKLSPRVLRKRTSRTTRVCARGRLGRRTAVGGGREGKSAAQWSYRISVAALGASHRPAPRPPRTSAWG